DPDQIVEVAELADLDAGDPGEVQAEQAVDATGQVDRPIEAQGEVARDLGKGQGHHRQVVAPQPEAGPADQETEPGRRHARERQDREKGQVAAEEGGGEEPVDVRPHSVATDMAQADVYGKP